MLVFLDIDGVMVPAKSWEKPNLLSDGFPEFSEKAIRVLQQIVSEHVTVLLTTSHKSRFNIEEWKRIFNNRGIDIRNLEKLEEPSFGTSRKDEILNWFKSNDIKEDFIIIDDEKSLNALPAFLKENLILTSPMIGLNDAHLDEINSKFRKKVDTI